MTQASIFGGLIIDVALIMAIVVLCKAWSVLKQTIKCKQQAYQPRKNVMESDMFVSVTGLFCSVVTLLLYLLLIAQMFFFNKITVGLFLGSMVLSIVIGVGLFFIIVAFQHEIEDDFTKPKLKI